MSFGKSKYLSPKTPNLKPSPSGQHTPEPSSLLYERYGKRLGGIEQNLNAICSQHDALMPLLTLLDTMPQLSKSEQQIRASTKKISEFEAKLEKLREAYQQSKGKEMLDGAEDSFSVLAKSLADCKEQVNQLSGPKFPSLPDPEHFKASFTDPLTNETEQRVEASRREIQIMLAEFRNDIELSYKKTLQMFRNKPIDRSEYTKILGRQPLPSL